MTGKIGIRNEYIRTAQLEIKFKGKLKMVWACGKYVADQADRQVAGDRVRWKQMICYGDP